MRPLQNPKSETKAHFLYKAEQTLHSASNGPILRAQFSRWLEFEESFNNNLLLSFYIILTLELSHHAQCFPSSTPSLALPQSRTRLDHQTSPCPKSSAVPWIRRSTALPFLTWLLVYGEEHSTQSMNPSPEAPSDTNSRN